MGNHFSATSSLQAFLFLQTPAVQFLGKANYFFKDPTITGFSLIIEGNLQGDYLNTKVRDRAIGKQRETKTGTETEKQLRSLWWSSTSLWLKKPYFIYTLWLMMFAPFCTYDNYGRNSSKKQPNLFQILWSTNIYYILVDVILNN